VPTLQVRDLPENLYRLLQEKAKRERRSLSQEAIVTLAKGLQKNPSPRDRRRKVLQEIERLPIDHDTVAQLDPVAIIMEDRQR